MSFYIWQCIMCKKRVQTATDFHINDRPICVECNAEMQPSILLSDEEVNEFLNRLNALFQ